MCPSFKRMHLFLYYYLFYLQIHFANSAKTQCRNIRVDEMEPFAYTSHKLMPNQQLQIKIARGQLNAGSFGQIFIGYTGKKKTINKDMAKDECVAIKVWQNDRQTLYLNGVEIWNKLHVHDENNEHIVNMMDYGMAYLGNSWCYITIMELGEMSLDQELFRGKSHRSQGGLKKMMKDIMSTLVVQHKVAVHMDFKPKNLLLFKINLGILRKESLIKLTDFDGCALYKENTQIAEVADNKLAVTGLYLGPEILEQFDINTGGGGILATAGKFVGKLLSNMIMDSTKYYTVTPKMDIWAAGITIYELMLSNFLSDDTKDSTINQGDVDVLIRVKLNLINELHRFAKLFENPGPSNEVLAIKLGLQQATVNPGCKDWWENYSGVVNNILDIWGNKYKMPDIAFLLGNMLDADLTKRMTAKGIIDYLEGKCQPIYKKIALFSIVTADDLGNMLGQEIDRLKSINTSESDKHYKLMKSIRKKLVSAKEKQSEFLHELGTRRAFCEH